MHDVMKPAATRPRVTAVGRTVLLTVASVLSLGGLVLAMKLLGTAVIVRLVVVSTVLAIFFATLAFRRFRRGQTTFGAIHLVLCLAFVLCDAKFAQFKTMMSSPMTMPATTVSSATVQAVDWAPVLSAVGSVSAVQGAMVSAELSGTVSQILFENGGTAKKGDVLMRLDTSSEDAQLRTAEADLALAKVVRSRL